MDEFDDVVIGAGQSGPSLGARLAASGRKVALIERAHLGGTCVNDGCTPTKTLVASARAAYVAREAARWGVIISGEIKVDYARVKARMDTVVKASVDGLQSWLGNTKNLTLITGHGRFVSPTELDVDGRRLKGQRFFINTGARATLPETPGLSELALTNTSLLQLDTLPEHLAIVGGGYVSLEFAQIFRRLGSRVTLLERGPRLLGREDADVAEVVAQVFAREGIAVRLKSEVVSAQKGGAGVRLTLKGGEVLEASHVLAATGRKPNTDQLGLDAAGLTTDTRGFIPVDDQLRTRLPHVYALGDVNGRGAFTHTSYNDFEVVAANLLDGGARTVKDRIFIANIYVDPPLGRVGLSETDARASGRPILKGQRPMTRVSRAFERGETDGFIKVLVDAETKLILGATILGVEGDEAIHTIAAVMTARVPYTVL